MKLLRWAAAAAVTLMSLMNVGAGTDDQTSGAVIVLGVALGVAGLVAAFGLVRQLGWGAPAALAISAVNLVMGIIGATAGWDGAAIGIVVSAVGLVLTLLSKLDRHGEEPGSLCLLKAPRRRRFPKRGAAVSPVQGCGS